ncbi:SRPBCC family protein [Kineosporia succinea]|uniref:Uncharacterized protein YndB with AHSA1/START domain n=1 Tax=Kineosporia succinea TaxID=84632 RepID=A0ABT9NXD5_9ACTN|nr:SRPBCC family protein [Kineosporia succinea]MDP9825088.1 uncharacterized protein YndB with AHSA1/START domain [Kineosporia succinea]
MDTTVTEAVRHHTFTVSRDFDAPPEAVFAAFSDDERRRRWFRMPGRDAELQLDFRVGGTERARATFTMLDGRTERLENHSRWIEIRPGRRLVHAYETYVNGARIWASLATIELWPSGTGTRLDWTEQAAFLDPDSGETVVAAEFPHLRGATQLRLNGLAQALG